MRPRLETQPRIYGNYEYPLLAFSPRYPSPSQRSSGKRNNNNPTRHPTKGSLRKANTLTTVPTIVHSDADEESSSTPPTSHEHPTNMPDVPGGEAVVSRGCPFCRGLLPDSKLSVDPSPGLKDTGSSGQSENVNFQNKHSLAAIPQENYCLPSSEAAQRKRSRANSMFIVRLNGSWGGVLMGNG